MNKKKEIKVVNVLSPYQLIINVGEEDGVSRGQRAFVYTLGEMMRDPDTGQDLEKVEIVRGTGRVIHVQRRIATVESDMTDERPTVITRKSHPFLGGFGDTEESRIERDDVPFDDPQIGDLVRLGGKA